MYLVYNARNIAPYGSDLEVHLYGIPFMELVHYTNIHLPFDFSVQWSQDSLNYFELTCKGKVSFITSFPPIGCDV